MISVELQELLTEKAEKVRESIIEMLVAAGSGHTAGPLGMADVFTAFYFYLLKHDPLNSKWEERDRLVLSNGHICPVLYSTLAHAGYFPVSELLTLRKFGSRLQGHPHREFAPFVETSSGPLGSGLSQAVGMALVDRLDARAGKFGAPSEMSGKYVYCFVGDGELDEGQNWEAIMLAAKEKLGNLILIVDRNNIQIDGFTEDIMPLESLSKKFEAFNWKVFEVNGHDFDDIITNVTTAKATFNKPSVIIAHTIPGKGVHEFEFKPYWHGTPPNKEQGEMALKELRSLGGKVKGEHE